MKTRSSFYRWNEELLRQNAPKKYLFNSNPVVRWIENGRLHAVRRALGATAHHSVLEVGCGSGDLLTSVTAKTKYGVDICRHLLNDSRNLVPNAQLILADAENLPFTCNSFDRVFCSSVLSHVMNPEAVLAESYRVLRADGRLVVSVSNEEVIQKGIRVAGLVGLRQRFHDARSTERDGIFCGEYHLHRFSFNYFRWISRTMPSPDKIIRIPSRLLPIHLVFVWTKK